MSIFAFAYQQTKQIKNDKVSNNYIDLVYWLFWNVLSIPEKELIIKCFLIYIHEKPNNNNKETLEYIFGFVEKKDIELLDNLGVSLLYYSKSIGIKLNSHPN